MQNDRFNGGPSMTGFIGDPEDYIPVAERVGAFYKDHPQGRILTAIVEHHREDGFVMIKAEVFRSFDDACPSSTGHAYEYRDSGDVNHTSYIENCETSAVGRSLAMLGYGVNRGIASREEMEKVARHTAPSDRQPVINRAPAIPEYHWTESNKGKLILMLREGQEEPKQIQCPRHQHATLTLRDGRYGAFLSHRHDEGYCSADIKWQPRSQAAVAGDLRQQLAAHNGRNGHGARVQ